MLKARFLLFYIFLISTSVFGQTEQKKVIAKKGEGIYTLLRKYDLNPTQHFKAFVDLNKHKLNPDNGLIVGASYVLPNKALVIKDTLKPSKKMPEKVLKPSQKTIKNPIFGKKYAVITKESEKLKGSVYYLISGHGGPDPGAVETYKGTLIAEDEYAYDVTLRLARKLLSNGAKVYIIIKDKNDGIRDKKILEVDHDEVCYPNKPISKIQKIRLRERTKAVNKLFLKHKGAYQRLIVTHIDSRSKSKNIDVFFYHHHKSKSGKKLALNIHNSFKQKYAKYQPNRLYSGTVSSRNLYLVKNTLPAMVFIELGNIKNKKDQKRILDYNNREALGKWIYEGLLVDFKGRKN